jgi:hypothetical protein
MRLPNIQRMLFIALSLLSANAALAAPTIYCEAEDANVRFFLKGIPQKVTAVVESYSIELKNHGASHSAANSTDAQSFGGVMFDERDQLHIKSQFYGPDMLFEAHLANSGTNEDGGIKWLGGYKLTLLDRMNADPIRGAIACMDGY